MPIPARCWDYIINCILHNVVKGETGASVVLVCPEVDALDRPHEGGFPERKCCAPNRPEKRARLEFCPGILSETEQRRQCPWLWSQARKTMA